jgi:hypothetical protein
LQSFLSFPSADYHCHLLHFLIAITIFSILWLPSPHRLIASSPHRLIASSPHRNLFYLLHLLIPITIFSIFWLSSSHRHPLITIASWPSSPSSDYHRLIAIFSILWLPSLHRHLLHLLIAITIFSIFW